MTTDKATETYEAPKLVVLGPAEDLTKAGGPRTKSDGPNPFHSSS